MINKILKRSTKAVCGVAEREVVVKSANLPKAINALKKSGHTIVGTSYGKKPNKKIWYVKKGFELL